MREQASQLSAKEKEKRGCSKGLILARVIGRKLAYFSPK